MNRLKEHLVKVLVALFAIAVFLLSYVSEKQDATKRDLQIVAFYLKYSADVNRPLPPEIQRVVDDAHVPEPN